MEILRLAVESRKVQLVDLALDLIQKLIAHKHIQGPISSVSHRRDPNKKTGRRRPTEDDEEVESVAGDDNLPQASSSLIASPLYHKVYHKMMNYRQTSMLSGIDSKAMVNDMQKAP